MSTFRIIFEGPSLIDGAPIVALAGAPARGSNAKTGPMLQTYILRADMPPGEALRSGADASICGDCCHRPALRRTPEARAAASPCYVAMTGPVVVWKGWKAGRYSRASSSVSIAAIGDGRMIRLGSYGDPAAVPWPVWRALLTYASDRTGYTHQWRAPIGQPLRGVCMASVDSESERDDAQSLGWATFRVAPFGAPFGAPVARARGEATCPASAEAGARVTCQTCPMKCNGESGRVAGRVIIDHAGQTKIIALAKAKAASNRAMRGYLGE